MTPDVIKELQQGDKLSDFHEKMLTHVKGLVKMSRGTMSGYYSDWDNQDSVYRGEVQVDADDVKQMRSGKPSKMIVPNTFAQVMTFTSFLFLMFNQNKTFFELNPTGEEDYGTKNLDCQSILERDLRNNKWSTLLFQHLLDVGRFGPAILECSWTRKITHAKITPEPNVVNFNSVQTTIRGESSWQEFIKYEGNLVRNVSPYRFFPDTRHPLVDFQKGEFCAAEEEYSETQLKQLEAVGEVAGVDHIAPMSRSMATIDRERGGSTRSSMMSNAGVRSGTTNGPRLITKVQVWLVPAQFTFGASDKKLGPEEFPILYHVWYANDNRVIRCEPAGWWHNEFGWTVSQFTPDMHRTLSFGLADLVYRLQDVISWFVNSHISSVRRVMQNRLVVDPAGIETKTLDGEGDIYLRKSASKSGVDRWIKQLQVQDVTSAHMGDVDMLGKLMEVVTGVNGNAMGQYNSGRRSAQEARTVTAGAAGRMKLHGHLIWDNGLGPLGKMMLSNSRQSLSLPSFMRAVGGDPALSQQRYDTFRGTPEEVICGDDFFQFDSTMASEKGYMAQSLQELLVTIMSNPMAAQQLDLDPRAMLDEIQQLRGAGPVGRFSLSKRVAAGAAPLPMPAPAPVPATA